MSGCACATSETIEVKSLFQNSYHFFPLVLYYIPLHTTVLELAPLSMWITSPNFIFSLSNLH